MISMLCFVAIVVLGQDISGVTHTKPLEETDIHWFPNKASGSLGMGVLKGM